MPQCIETSISPEAVIEHNLELDQNRILRNLFRDEVLLFVVYSFFVTIIKVLKRFCIPSFVEM